MHMSKSKRALRLVKPAFYSAGGPAGDPVNLRAPATRDYYRRIEDYAHRIRRTHDVGTIIHLLDEALGETRALNDAPAPLLAPSRLANATREIEALKHELEQLRSLVHVDHLTGALNRGGLENAYQREASRADRSDTPLGVALLDLDDFKALNDGHGHPAGDAALGHFARMIKSTLRPSDVTVRYGGEEFLLLLPGSSSAQAQRALRRLQLALSREPLIYRDRTLPMTFSAGIAVRRRGEPKAHVIARADEALYEAKRNGKDRAVTAG